MSLRYNDTNGHVQFASFGLDKLDHLGELDKMLREFPAVRPPVAQLATLACYQTEYGIFDHEAPRPDRPLALVALHPKEDILEGSGLYTHIRQFYNYKIHRLFGVSLTEFLELPPYVVELIYAIAKDDLRKTEKTHQDIQRQLNMDFDHDV